MAGSASAPTIGPLVEEMKAKGYQGPFATLCDGIMVLVFHGRNVSLDPDWIEPDANPFQMRVLDCKSYCQDSPMFAMGEGADAIDARLMQARANPRQSFQNLIPDAQTTPCLLSYPRGGEEPPDGAHFVADAMEDLWNIFLFEGYFYFTRSWTGQLRYRAKLLFRPGALFVTEVESSRTRAPNDLDRSLEDQEMPIRQVDFLIKTLLYKLHAPAPLPQRLSEAETGTLALFSLTEYGRWGWSPTFEDTTEYRFCLNGTQGRFLHCSRNTVLMAVKAVEESDTQANRQRLLQELRGQSLHFAFSVAEVELQKGPITAETPIQFAQQQWNGMPAVLAYTDPALRVEPSHGCLSLEAASFSDFVGKQNERTCLVINPGGPATCTIGPEELKSLAQ